MEFLEILINFIQQSDISEVFNLDNSSLIILLVGSFLVGLICLTLFYSVFYGNKNGMNYCFMKKP